MSFAIREMNLGDYDEVYDIWTRAQGLSLGEDDQRAPIDLYLRRNPGLCFVAYDASRIVGTVLAGHDGRRGILRHLVVLQEYRRRGLGRQLVEMALKALREQGIQRCNLYVMNDNPDGRAFWEHLGFYPLPESFRTFQALTAPPG